MSGDFLNHSKSRGSTTVFSLTHSQFHVKRRYSSFPLAWITPRFNNSLFLSLVWPSWAHADLRKVHHLSWTRTRTRARTHNPPNLHQIWSTTGALRSYRRTVVCRLEICMPNSATSVKKKRIRISSRHWFGPNLNHANRNNEKNTTEGKHVRVVFTAQAFVSKIGGGIHSVQWPSGSIWVPRPIVVTVLLSSCPGEVVRCYTGPNHMTCT